VDCSELTASKLGTQEYWNETFRRELENYHEHKDVGEVWFGNASMKRVIDWMKASPLVSADSSVLDVGCGNGFMLVKLAKNGFTRLTGVDYASSAIELACSIAHDEHLDITYEVCNILEMSDGTSDSSHTLQHIGDDSRQPISTEVSLCQRYDIILDKGTYDAISLNPDDARTQRCRYLRSLCQLVRPGGLFIITSCNWTRDELLQHFGSEFELHENIPTTQFQFGGTTGCKETVLVFRRNFPCL
jgi:SAM-dependent methyltransferase